MENNNSDEIRDLEIEDIIEAIDKDIKKKNKSIVRFVRDLVQKRCIK